MTQDTQTNNGTIWLGDVDDPMNAATQLEGEPTRIKVERTDVDEIAIHATMPSDVNALVSLYMTRAEATLLARKIDAAATPDA